MNATVHSLNRARGKGRSRALSPESMRVWSVMQGGYLEAFQIMLEQADDVLFDWAERGERTRECMNLMRTLRMSRDALRGAFESALSDAPMRLRSVKSLEEFDASELALQDGEAVELGIAAQNVVTRVEGRLVRNLFECRARLREGEQRLGTEMPESMLDPRLGVDGLIDALASLNADVTERLVMIKLYERQLLARFPSMILAVSSQLDELGVPRSVTPAVGRAQATSTTAGAQGAAPGAGDAVVSAAQAIAGAMPDNAGGWQPSDLVVAVQALLQTLQQRGVGGAATGMPLAHAMPGQMTAELPVGLPPVQLLGQRAAMAGEMIQAYVGDPLVSHDVQDALSAVSAPVLRVAMADPGVLTDRAHPVRAALDRLAVLGRRVGDSEARAQMLQVLVSDIETAAETSAPSGEKPDAMLDDRSLESFREQLREGVRERQRWIVEAARSRAATELEARLRRHPGVPQSPRDFLVSAIEPLVGILLMRVGDGGELWSLLMRVVDRVLVVLDTQIPLDEREVESLGRSLEAMMRAAGFSNTRRDRLLGEWRELALNPVPDPDSEPVAEPVAEPASEVMAEPRASAPDAEVPGKAIVADMMADLRAEVRAAANAPRADRPVDPHTVLAGFFRVGAWFKVYDPTWPRPRYGQVASVQPGSPEVRFVSVTGRNEFMLPWQVLLAGAAEGKTMPLNRDPAFFAARDALGASPG